MREIEIEIGDLIIKIRPRNVLLFSRQAGPTHATFYFEPQQDGPHAGKWTPHVTRPRRGKKVERRTLARVEPQDLVESANALSTEFFRAWRGATHQTGAKAIAGSPTREDAEFILMLTGIVLRRCAAP